jgi:hypothetical protein
MELKRTIKYIDIFGEPVSLNIKNKFTSKTVFGGILTIITMGLLFGATWSMSNDLIFKSQPTTDLEDQLFRQRPKYYLDKYNLPVSIAFQDYDQKSYNIPSYFKFEIINTFTYNINSTSRVEYYEIEKCRSDHFPGLLEDDIDKSGMLNYYCIKDQNITIGGYWDNEYIQYNIFRVRYCNNETDGGICAPLDEINSFLTREPYAFNVYFMNTIINPRDYEKPTQGYLLNLYKNIRITTSKSYSVFIRSQEIQTDKGILFEDIYSETSYAYDNDDYDDSDAVPESILDIYFYVANHKPIFHRRYLKVQTIIANIGGLAKALLLGMYLLSYYFSITRLKTKLMNSIFYFDLKAGVTVNLPQDTRKISIGPSVSGIIKGDIFENNDIPDLVKQDNNKVLTYKREGRRFTTVLQVIPKPKAKVKKLKFSFCDIIRMIICNKCDKGAKAGLYASTEKIITEYLDITKIIHRFEEYEKFKLTMLNETQLAMFQCITKEFVSIEDKLRVQSELSRLKILSQDRDQLLSLIKEYKSQIDMGTSRMNFVDFKLFNMLDEEIKLELGLRM